MGDAATPSLARRFMKPRAGELEAVERGSGPRGAGSGAGGVAQAGRRDRREDVSRRGFRSRRLRLFDRRLGLFRRDGRFSYDLRLLQLGAARQARAA